jgi:hypothetical protein
MPAAATAELIALVNQPFSDTMVFPTESISTFSSAAVRCLGIVTLIFPLLFSNFSLRNPVQVAMLRREQ